MRPNHCLLNVKKTTAARVEERNMQNTLKNEKRAMCYLSFTAKYIISDGCQVKPYFRPYLDSLFTEKSIKLSF